jgi:isoprenylcysteine carboxyl methyltransferase (ICMT) family protein YpbQ
MLGMCNLPLKMNGISLVNVVNVVFVSIQGTLCVNLASTKAWNVKILLPNNVGYVRSTIEAATIEDEWV